MRHNACVPTSIATPGKDQPHRERALTAQLHGSGAALVHDFVIDNIGGKKFDIESQPHGKATGNVTPRAPGTYQFYCSQPGHLEAGMAGTLAVS
jgi:uncharacterized cupredoxin-like copper-binding protein